MAVLTYYWIWKKIWLLTSLKDLGSPTHAPPVPLLSSEWKMEGSQAPILPRWLVLKAFEDSSSPALGFVSLRKEGGLVTGSQLLCRYILLQPWNVWAFASEGAPLEGGRTHMAFKLPGFCLRSGGWGRSRPSWKFTIFTKLWSRSLSVYLSRDPTSGLLLSHWLTAPGEAWICAPLPLMVGSRIHYPLPPRGEKNSSALAGVN